MTKGKRWRLHWISTVVTLMLSCSTSTLAAADLMPAAVLIRVGAGDTPEVILINQPLGPDMLEQPGLIVWSEQGHEHWRILPYQKEEEVPRRRPWPWARGFNGANRVDSVGCTAMATLQLAQLRGLSRLRGGFFLQPPTPRACLLDPKITIQSSRGSQARFNIRRSSCCLSSDGRRFASRRCRSRKARRRSPAADIPNLPKSSRRRPAARSAVRSRRQRRH